MVEVAIPEKASIVLLYSILYIITEIKSAVAYEHTVPMGAPDIPNAGFLIRK